MANRPPRILHVFRTYLPDTRGGAQEVIRQVCLATSRLGLHTRIFVPSPEPDPALIVVDGIEVVRVHLNAEIASCGFCFTGLAEFRRQVEWADVVHYHFPWPFADAMHFTARVNKPSVVTYHADIVRQRGLLQLYRPLMKRFLDDVDRIIATSDVYLHSSPNLIARKDKVDVIALGLDEESYPEPDEEHVAEVRAQVGEGFFLFIGMLRYYKGLHVLLDACEGAPFRVVIAGDGPLERELKAKAEALALDNVTFCGEVSDDIKVALLQLCRGVVLPSHLRAEAFGVSLLEGTMYSRPLITAETGSGTSYVNRDGETGLVVPPGDAPSLAGALTRLHNEPDLASRLGRGARERFDRLFTAEILGRRHEAVYRELMSNARHGTTSR